jgi:uncharacterized protein
VEAFNYRAAKLIQSTGLPHFKIDEKNQRGTSFGKRLRNALEDVYNQGFEKVIIIGNDCIELQKHHLLDAKTKLQTNSFVLGADFNGGAYLIGVTKSAFDTNKFENISWQTSSVFNELHSLLGYQTIGLLSGLNDCNSINDLKKAINMLPFSDPFRSILLFLFQNKNVLNNFEIVIVSNEFCLLNLNKGSPFSFTILV